MVSRVRALCVCVVLWTFLGLAHSQNGAACKTRQGGDGKCMRREACKPLIEELGGDFNSKKSKDILLRWRCNRGILVCCPDFSSEDVYSRPPPSVTRHRNLRLLDQTSCGDYTEDRVFGGNKTGVIEFPWMALISMDENNKRDFKCGGSIINERYILTAAHCVTGLSPGSSLVGVRVGEHDISTEKDCEPGSTYCAPHYQDFAIEDVIPHPGYVGTKPARNLELQNDIALIRIDGKIESEDNAQPICLPTYKAVQELKLTGLNLTVAGWGRTNMDRQGNRVSSSWSQPSPDLLKAHLPVLSNRRCGQIFNGTLGDGISYKQMCAGGVKGVSSCGGDSGGPLVYLQTDYNGIIRAVQYGIVSGGHAACGGQDSPAVFTRVAYYMDWILDNLKP